MSVAYPTAFVDELKLGAGAMLRVVTVLGTLAFIGLWFVDPLLAVPEELPLAREVRVIVIAILMAIFAASFNRRWVARWARPAAIAACFATGGAVIVLTYLTGGGSSDYHEALYLTIFAYALLPIPWARWDAPITFAFLLATYDVVLLAGGRPGSWGIFATHNALIGGGVVIASVLNQIVINSRLNAFNQRAELAMVNRQLQALDEAKSRFFANISHELRTPLTLTLAPLDALLEEGGREPLTEGQREKLRLAQRNALRLLRLVDDLLALTKAEAASLQLQVGPVDLAQMLDLVALDIRGLTARKAITLDVDVAPDLPIIEADEHLIERVVLNLIGNAAKFTGEGGRIVMRARPWEDGVEVVVEDTGIGIAPAALPHIFDRFYQADSGSTRRVGGTGIGLALVREIIELHRGRIQAESVVGERTTIRCWLPVKSHATGANGEAELAGIRRDGLPEWHQAIRSARSYRLQGIDDATERRIAPRPQHKGDAPHVLVVEDNPDMIRFLVALLASDYNVLSAQNGRDGLRMATERRPDLIISDVMMPEMNGFEMLEQLRRQPATASIPLIFLTARGSDEDRLVGRQGGAETYLAKPFRSEELLAAVDALLAHQTQMQSHASAHHDEELLFLAGGVADQLARSLDALDRASDEATRARALADLHALEGELRAVIRAGAEPSVAPSTVDDRVRAVLASVAETHPSTPLHALLDAPVAARIAPAELEDALRFLVSRAITKSPPHAAIHVATERRSDDRVLIKVSDEGPGVPSGDAERVFFAFYDDDDPRSGLGLVRVRRLLEARGGGLTLETARSRGTTFVMQLPVATAPTGAGA
ncbi:MAG: response regulator [Deltaproteobacteria bacterium]|nr:MAG: response regulator [Deltaproteobacteria bacterium]